MHEERSNSRPVSTRGSRDDDHPIEDSSSTAVASSTTLTPLSTTDQTARRIELILQQLESIPTLSSVAIRLLQLTSDDSTQGKDVVKLVSTDPALSAKVLKLCRCSERGRANNVTSVERAVLLLGFDALRSAVLSVQAFDLFDGMESPGGEKRGDKPVFDRVSFWQHSLAVASICETLAGTSGACRRISKPDAFVCGLLHDLGMLAVHVLLPRSFDRVCEFAETQGVSLDQACRRIIGMDTHTAGRRLAEHWRLPYSLGDVLWLHGQRYDSLPNLPHRAQIGLVTLADAVARRQCLAPTGHGPRGENIAQLCEPLGIKPAMVEELIVTLHHDVATRAAALGMDKKPDNTILLSSISRANEALGRINTSLRKRAVLAQRQGETLKTITQFYESAVPGVSVVGVMGMVVTSAASQFDGSFFAILYQPRESDPWQLIHFAADGRCLRSQMIEPPTGSTAVSDLADHTQVSMQVVAMLPWLTEYLGEAHDLRRVQLLPLRCGWGVNAVLIHDCSIDGRDAQDQLDALSRTWAAAIAAGAQHEGAKRLGEQLAEANRALLETQDELSRSRAMAAVGEMAAGAAHEMNNPLTVISGRSQLLANRLTTPEERTMAVQMVEQSHRLSNMITALRRFAEPVEPNRTRVELMELIGNVVADIRGRTTSDQIIDVAVAQPLPPAWIDPQLFEDAVSELLVNAIEAEDCHRIEVSVQIDAADDRLVVQVIDDGSGLSEHALAHAFDPFFSEKRAGRKTGMGLARARRILEAHGGFASLENGVEGAIATLWLDHWRSEPVREAA